MANEPIIEIRRGVVCADPEVKTIQSGGQMLSVRVACNISHRDKQSNQWVQDQTLYYGVALWDESQIALYQNLRKGDTVEVRGQLHESEGQGKDGTVMFRDIRFASIALLHGPQGQQQSGGRAQSGAWQRGQRYSANRPQQPRQQPQPQPQQGWANSGDYQQGAGFDDGGADAF